MVIFVFLFHYKFLLYVLLFYSQQISILSKTACSVLQFWSLRTKNLNAIWVGGEQNLLHATKIAYRIICLIISHVNIAYFLPTLHATNRIFSSNLSLYQNLYLIFVPRCFIQKTTKKEQEYDNKGIRIFLPMSKNLGGHPNVLRLHFQEPF